MKKIMNKSRFFVAALGVAMLCGGGIGPSMVYGAGADIIHLSGYLIVEDETVWVVSSQGTYEVTNSALLLQKGAEDGDEVNFKIREVNGGERAPIVIVDDLAGRTQPN